MRVFYFNITYRCNSRCMFCAANHPLLEEDNEMSLEEFESVLRENNVGANDRVIVNGGEPTMHRHFFEILDAVERYGATIDLFTNGMRFVQKEFADKTLIHRKLYIRVPLFGSSAKVHDTLTGCPGSFQRVVKGLDYLCQHLSTGNRLEIKLLLSKATISENEGIYTLVKQRWSNPEIVLSLNPLLISECVKMHKDLFIDTYENMLNQSDRLIRKIQADHMNFSMALIPFCAFPNEELLKLCHGNTIIKDSYYTDPVTRKKVDEMKGREACLKCRYVSRCNGYPDSYIKYFGSQVMKPIHNIDIDNSRC